MNLPKISVITVVRNDVAHIEQTMLSVLGQTYGNVEYIVIDGGSTDGTVDIIKKYADKLAYWVSEPDGGIYPAMNKGLQHATGEWVNFMNSGDSFADENVLNYVFGKDSSNNIDSSQMNSLKMIGGGTINVYESDPSKTFLDPAKSPSVIPMEIPFSHQASFTKREVCYYDTNYKYAADYKVMYEVYFKYGHSSILSLDIPIAKYLKEDSLSTINHKKVKGEYLRIQSSHKNIRWWKEYIKWRFL